MLHILAGFIVHTGTLTPTLCGSKWYFRPLDENHKEFRCFRKVPSLGDQSASPKGGVMKFTKFSNVELEKIDFKMVVSH